MAPESAHYVVVFKSRLRPGVESAYLAHAEAIYQIAVTMPGLVSATDYTAEDGERVSIIEFDTLDHLHAAATGVWTREPSG